MSFLKKIKKVLSLLSPWSTPPARKRGRKSIRRKPAAQHKLRRVKKLKRKTAALKRSSVRRGQAKNKKAASPKSSKKRPGIKKAAAKKAVRPAKQDKRTMVGEVTHYFDRIKVGAFTITGAPIAIGDTLEFEGRTGSFKQEITSLQINRKSVPSARAGDEVGMLVKKPVREGDYVFKSTETRR